MLFARDILDVPLSDLQIFIFFLCVFQQSSKSQDFERQHITAGATPRPNRGDCARRQTSLHNNC